MSLITSSAAAGDFSARVEAGKIALASLEGEKYETSFEPAIRNALLKCVPAGSAPPADLETFRFVADVERSGRVSSVQVDPVTSVSRCFAQHFAVGRLPPPPMRRERNGLFPVMDSINFAEGKGKDRSVTTENVPDSDIAISVATKFMKALDEGNMSATWPHVSDLLKSRMSQITWSETLGGLRSAVGPVNKRTFQGALFVTKLADVPVGRYYIVQFHTDFANLSAEEKTVLSLEHGEWKILGCFLSKNVTLKFP